MHPPPLTIYLMARSQAISLAYSPFTRDLVGSKCGKADTVDVSGSPAPPGGFINLTFEAPGYNGVPYLAAASLGSAPGTPVISGNPPVVGNVPLNTDALFFLSLNSPGTLFNFTGLIGPAGTSPGIIFIPNDPGLSGLSFFVAFLAVPPAPNPFGISDAALVSIQ